jgi:leucyl aminopeptidase
VTVGRKLAGRKRNRVAVALPERGDPTAVASALVEGLVVGTRGPDLRKTEPARHSFEAIDLCVPPDHPGAGDLASAVARGVVVGESVNLARDLANTPPADKPPTRLAARAREVAIASGLSIDVWDAARIAGERFGGLTGVSAGSDEPPAFVVLELRNGDGPTLALVGKGVTFDSGGLSIKPSASMEDMKSDMTGAAVVLATLSAAARLNLPVNLRGYLALTENMTGGKAMKLGDVLTMRNGKTVEVLNTDAEGRLILADALSYAVEAKPDRVLDLATLTGACMVALGTKVAGLFSNDDGFAQVVLEACRKTGERAWRMPLDDDYKEGLKSQVADLKNVGGKWGGAVTAAKFLQQFVGETPWVHLDIAGPSWADSDAPTRDAGGTGCFVRTLVTLLESGVGRTQG